MFTGLTVASLLADAEDMGALFVVPFGVLAAFWAGRRLIGIGRAFLGG